MQYDPEQDEDEVVDEYRWGRIYRKAQQKKIVEAFRLFRSQGIEPVLFKGWAIARYYPESVSRISSDTDIAVAASDHAAAESLRTSPTGRKLVIDLHNEFSRHDSLDWKTLFSRCEKIDIDGESIRILCPEDHLRVVCVHWLIDGGQYREKLWDIYYLVANRPKGFDWQMCLDEVEPKRRRWIVCAIGLAAKHFGLDLSETPIANAAETLPKWLTARVEKEWASSTKLEPLKAHFRNPRKFLIQLKKRTPPNPIAATVDVGGSFDSKLRLHYQLRSFSRRGLASLRRSIAYNRTENEAEARRDAID